MFILLFLFSLASSAFADPSLDARLLDLVERGGEAAQAQALLTQGADPNARDHLTSALYLAAQRGEKDIVDILLKAGADPNHGVLLSAEVDFPLHVVARLTPTCGGYAYLGKPDARLPIFLALLAAGAKSENVDQLSALGCTPRMSGTALRWAVLDEVRLVARTPAGVPAQAALVKGVLASKLVPPEYTLPLFFEVSQAPNAAPILEAFLSTGTDVNTVRSGTDRPRETALTEAVEGLQYENVDYLLLQGARPELGCAAALAVRAAMSPDDAQAATGERIFNRLLTVASALGSDGAKSEDCGYEAEVYATTLPGSPILTSLLQREPRLRQNGASLVVSCLAGTLSNCSARKLAQAFQVSAPELNREIRTIQFSGGPISTYATGRSALEVALNAPRCSDLDGIDLLLSLGADAKATWPAFAGTDSYLRLAVDRGCSAPVVKALLKHGAPLTVAYTDGMRPLDYAIAGPRPISLEVVKALLAAGAPVDWTQPQSHQTLAHYAAAKASAETLALLAKAGAQMDVTVAGAGTPIEVAICATDSLNAVQTLAGLGARTGGLFHAFERCGLNKNGFSETVRALLKLGVPPTVDADYPYPGWNLLHFAAAQDAVDIVPELVAARIDINAVSRDGLAPLEVALRVALIDPKMVAALLSAGAKPRNDANGALAQLVTGQYFSPSFAAVAKLLIDAGARPADYRTLYWAAGYKVLAKLLPLLKEHAVDFNDKPYLVASIAQEDEASFKLLESYGAAMEVAGEKGTPIFYALDAKSELFINNLLRHPLSIDAYNPAGETPLIHLLNREAPSVARVQALLDHRADVNRASQAGLRPLHVAIQHRAGAAIVKALVAKGADVNAATPDKKTPVQLALDSGQTAEAFYFCRQGATDAICTFKRTRLSR